MIPKGYHAKWRDQRGFPNQALQGLVIPTFPRQRSSQIFASTNLEKMRPRNDPIKKNMGQAPFDAKPCTHFWGANFNKPETSVPLKSCSRPSPQSPEEKRVLEAQLGAVEILLRQPYVQQVSALLQPAQRVNLLVQKHIFDPARGPRGCKLWPGLDADLRNEVRSTRGTPKGQVLDRRPAVRVLRDVRQRRAALRIGCSRRPHQKKVILASPKTPLPHHPPLFSEPHHPPHPTQPRPLHTHPPRLANVRPAESSGAPVPSCLAVAGRGVAGAKGPRVHVVRSPSNGAPVIPGFP